MVDIEAGVFPGKEVGEFGGADEFGVAEGVEEAVAEEFDGGSEIFGGHAVEAAVGGEESVGGDEVEVGVENEFRIKETTAFETVGALIPLPRAITARETGPFRCTNSRTRRSLIFKSNSEATGDSIIDTFLNTAYKS